MEPVNTLGSEYGNMQVAPLPTTSPLPASTASPQLNTLPAAVALTPMASKHMCKPVHKSYMTPTICSVCRRLLWFGSQGYHCAVCNKDYHKACLPSYNKTHRCKPVLMTYMIPTSCTLCSRILTGIHNQGYHCGECGSNYHACCRAPNSSTSLSPPSASSAGKERVCAQCRWPGRGHQCDVCKRFVCKNCMPRPLHAPPDTLAVLGLAETSSDKVECRVCDNCACRAFSPVETLRRVTVAADERAPTLKPRIDLCFLSGICAMTYTDYAKCTTEKVLEVCTCPLIDRANLSDGTCFYLAGDEHRIILAFRGTDNVQNIVTDLKGVGTMVPFHVRGCFVHEGFACSYATARLSVLCMVRRHLDKYPGASRDITVTGHSLGGALATLCAFDLRRTLLTGEPGLKCVTFGSPRVGNRLFAETYNRLVPNTLRVANKLDVVPRVPPASSIFPYVHVGTHVDIDPDKGNSATVMQSHGVPDPPPPTVPCKSTKSGLLPRGGLGVLVYGVDQHVRYCGHQFPKNPLKWNHC